MHLGSTREPSGKAYLTQTEATSLIKVAQSASGTSAPAANTTPPQPHTPAIAVFCLDILSSVGTSFDHEMCRGQITDLVFLDKVPWEYLRVRSAAHQGDL